MSSALLVRMEAKQGKEADVEQFLHAARPVVEDEPRTTAWFGIRAGGREYGIFDAFPDEQGRHAHLSGPAAEALEQNADELLAGPPDFQDIEVLAHKLPRGSLAPSAVTKGLLLTLEAKDGREEEVEQFLCDTRSIVVQEPGTTAWFAIKLGGGTYGIFEVFPDASGRFAHLTGQVPRDLAEHALPLLGSVPDMDMLNVVTDRLPPRYP